MATRAFLIALVSLIAAIGTPAAPAAGGTLPVAARQQLDITPDLRRPLGDPDHVLVLDRPLLSPWHHLLAVTGGILVGGAVAWRTGAGPLALATGVALGAIVGHLGALGWVDLI